jgi:hypothetical protein
VSRGTAQRPEGSKLHCTCSGSSSSNSSTARVYPEVFLAYKFCEVSQWTGYAVVPLQYRYHSHSVGQQGSTAAVQYSILCSHWVSSNCARRGCATPQNQHHPVGCKHSALQNIHHDVQQYGKYRVLQYSSTEKSVQHSSPAAGGPGLGW